MAFYPLSPIRSLDDVKKLENTSLNLSLSTKSTYKIFVHSAEAFGDKTALRFLKTAEPGNESIAWSYTELLKRIHKTANMLHELGVGPNDAVSILLPGCLEYHLALWGGEAAGIVNPLNPLLSEDSLVELIQASNSRVLIAYGDNSDAGYWEKALSLMAKAPSLKTILRVSPHDDAPENSRVYAEGVLDFNQAIDEKPDDHLVSGRQIEPDDVAAYFHTGGTTGSPKLAIHTHGNQVFTAWASVQLQGISQKDVTINGYPLFHVAGVLPGSLASLSAGVEVIIPTIKPNAQSRDYPKLLEAG